MNGVPELVCLGNFTIDDVVLPNGTERPGCTGGDALYATLAARSWLPATELVAPIGNDLPAHVIERIGACGLSVAGMARRDLPTLHNRVAYEANGDRTWTLYASEEAFDVLSPLPADIPVAFGNARAFLILAMTLPAQRRLVTTLKASRSAIVALDPQEDYIFGNEADLRAMIGQVDIFLPSAEEVRRLLATEDWSAAARSFAALGPRLIVIKLGTDGCLVYDAVNDVEFTVPAYPGAQVVDTTGAGDSFCGAFMAAYLQDPADLRGAARAGAVAASFTVGGYGVDPLFETTSLQMRERLDGWHP
ncbi:carbohydrate kinase family protein [Devosia psychrophila]|uniref:Sugar or nucleoside kinase, ribokinase family n=1 Tax=Devosia psychrophila TaxID=728005 RepID=A0A0F5PW05_9HYPH|nr:carbohydrate kinase family protein [Devosia psychrophila]KKC32813.1 hypothetical protein WH91_12050 [Devosia psychrophila]SFD21629.1 Sugar or nucleoside kinase, ribokinase family [Devosia psychrophila]